MEHVAGVAKVHAANYGVYGARKVQPALRREQIEGARCAVAASMRQVGPRVARRGKVRRTAIADPKVVLPDNLGMRNFDPETPDRVWGADFTYVLTWSDWVYVSFVIDAHARRILGWRCSNRMMTRLVMNAIEHAIWTRGRH